MGSIFNQQMVTDSAQGDSAAALSPSVAGSAGDVALPRFVGLRWSRLPLPRVRVALGPVAGRTALASVLVSAVALVLFSTSRPTVLVPRSNEVFPGWFAGPLHLLTSGLPKIGVYPLDYGLTAVLVVMLVAYFVILASAGTLSMRLIVGCIVALHVILLISPPLQETDLFNYLGYARLGALHGLNPYTHVMLDEFHDPVYLFGSWHNLHSPYGPVFTAITYLLPLGSLSLSYWLLKVVTVLASLGFLGLVWRCAVSLGRDPRYALAFVALNPIYLVYAVGGFHNDFFMLISSMLAIWLVLARRDRYAGAVLMLAVAVKFTAVVLLPFLLVAVRPSRVRMREILEGAVLGAIPLVAMSLALFGFSLPDLQDQSTLLTNFSVPNVIGLVIGGGGTPTLLRVLDFLVVVWVVLLLFRARGDWISRAGWATLALLISLAWLMPWYVIWVLPLAALGTSVRLRRAALAFTVFVTLTFLPALQIYMNQNGINPMATPAGMASQKIVRARWGP